MAQNNRVIPSILLSTGIFLVFQLTMFRLVASRRALDGYILPFAITTISLHLFLLGALLYMRHDFAQVSSGRPLDRINTANLLSLFRISSTPSILFYLILSREYDTLGALLLFTAVAFLTDLLDGFVSRHFNQVTRIGRYLDSMSDYGILLTVTFAINYFGLISTWFFALTLVRFIGQGVGMTALLGYNGSVDSRSTFLGKTSVFVTMVTFGLSLLQLLPSTGHGMSRAIQVIEYPVAVLLVVSFIEKVLLLRQGFLRAVRRKRRINASR